VEVAIFFNEKEEKEDLVNVSFRSTGEIDVNGIATILGGGGHKKAAGCLLRMPLDEAKSTILEIIRKAVRALEAPERGTE
jgi:phosphoesterase RecJ-like protein